MIRCYKDVKRYRTIYYLISMDTWRQPRNGDKLIGLQVRGEKTVCEFGKIVHAELVDALQEVTMEELLPYKQDIEDHVRNTAHV